MDNKTSISFAKLQSRALIKDLELSKYVYLRCKTEEYKKYKKFDNFDYYKKIFILFYDMQKQKKIWRDNFFEYFKLLIKEDEISKYETFDKNEKLKLKEILVVLSKLDDKNININELTANVRVDLANNVKIDYEKGALHKSFATKLLATINPIFPIIDSNVLDTLKDKIENEESLSIMNSRRHDLPKKIDATLKVYTELFEIEQKMVKWNKTSIDQFINFYDNNIKKLMPEYKPAMRIKEPEDTNYKDYIEKFSFSSKDLKILDFFLWKKAMDEITETR